MTLAEHLEVGVAALTKVVWWDLHLASLLKHLFSSAITEMGDHLATTTDMGQKLVGAVPLWGRSWVSM